MKYSMIYKNGEYRVHKHNCQDLKAGVIYHFEAASVKEAIEKSRAYDLESSGGDEEFADAYYKVLPCIKEKHE